MLQWTYSSAFECTAVVAFIQTYEHTMNQNKMHYFFSFLCISVFISFLLSQIPFTAAGRTPSRQYGKLRSRAATGGVINVAGLDVLRTYVCPPCSNAVRRQMDTKRPGSITVAIPMAEVSELWQELQWILEQLSVLLDAEGLLPGSTTTVALPTVLASLTKSAMPVTGLPLAPIEVSNPSLTNPVIIATTMPAAAIASISLVAAASGNIPEVTDTAAGSAAVPSTVSMAAGTVGIPGSAPGSSPGSEAIATPQGSSASSGTTSFPDGTAATQGSMCYATQTVDKTTTVSLAAVTAFEAAATSASTLPDSALASAAGSNTSSTVDPPNGGAFVATSVSSGPSPTGTSSYTFDSQSTQNIAVYYGQSGATGEFTLEALCADPNIDIVILAFVIASNYDGKYPDLNFGAACGEQTSEIMAEAPGLLSCPQLESYIDICQQKYGKKVLLSIGGSTSSLSFANASDASDFANILWQLFGPPGSIDIQLRPFGNVSIDGFDVGKLSHLLHHVVSSLTSTQTWKTSSRRISTPSDQPCAQTTNRIPAKRTTSLPHPNVHSRMLQTHYLCSYSVILSGFNSTITHLVR